MLRKKIERFVTHYLENGSPTTTKSKFVHDPVWGTIELYPYEVAVLDSPLLQRLRQIHQTGFVYATFPAACHKRFEHTIGVMHLAGRLATTLRKRHPKLIDDNTTEQKVRLAAAMHDVGHSAFSHTTEEIYETKSDLHKLLQAGGEFQGKGAGEVLSYLITTSQAFRNYFRQLKKQHRDLWVDVDDFAPLMLGRAKPEKQFEADIISGPVDADKLDYFPRDGRAAGIELAVDIERLLHCLSIAQEKRDGKTFQTLVVNRGGYNAIQQLLFARATLFASVYHHHKVRACDCMVKATFEYFSERGLKFKRNSVFSGLPLKSAAEFLFVTDLDFFSEAYNHAPSSLQHELIHDLLYRRLFRRAVTVSRNTVNNFEDSQQKAGYGQFYNFRSNKKELRELAMAIHQKAKTPCSPFRVWLDVPRDPSFKKAGDALVNLAARGGQPRLTKLETVIPIVEWVQTYQQYYAQSFLFGPPEKGTRAELARAALTVFDERFGLRLNSDALADDIREDVEPFLTKLNKRPVAST